MNKHLLSNKKVLVVEDEMLVAMLIEDMLGDLGCTAITVVADIEAALHCIALDEFDLATLDLNLNGARSYPVADCLMDRHIPFAFSTGYNAGVVGAGYGDSPILAKPYSPSQLEAVMAELVARADSAPITS